MHKKLLIGIIAVAGLLVVVTTAIILALTPTSRVPEPSSQSPASQTLTGKVICLPKLGDGPHTLECAIGIQTDEGKKYALKNNPVHDLSVDSRVKVIGTVAPPTDTKNYDVIGTIDVEQIEKTQ